MSLSTFDLRNHARGNYISQNIRSRDRREKMAHEVRDVFLKSPAWDKLMDRVPSRDFIIGLDGKEIQRKKK
jgi:hypothetical protein